MKKKVKLDAIQVESFVTIETSEREMVKGGDSNNRGCPTAYACPSQWPVCTHPFHGC